MKKNNVQLIFIRRMMENMLDQGEMAEVLEMSSRIDAEMTRRISENESAALSM